METTMTKTICSFVAGVVLAVGFVACGGANKGEETMPKPEPAAADGGVASPPTGQAPGNPCGTGSIAGNPCNK